MPTPRQSGQEIDQNVRRSPNISPAARHRIIAKREEGVSVRELAAEFGRSESAIKYTVTSQHETTVISPYLLLSE
jgi:transposase-like protein